MRAELEFQQFQDFLGGIALGGRSRRGWPPAQPAGPTAGAATSGSRFRNNAERHQGTLVGENGRTLFSQSE